MSQRCLNGFTSREQMGLAIVCVIQELLTHSGHLRSGADMQLEKTADCMSAVCSSRDVPPHAGGCCRQTVNSGVLHEHTHLCVCVCVVGHHAAIMEFDGQKDAHGVLLETINSEPIALLLLV